MMKRMHTLETMEIRDLIQAFATAADSRDWTGLRSTFADRVSFDYTSVAGGEPAVLDANDIVAGWEQGLGRYKQTKHNFSDFHIRLEGDAATCEFTGQATHVRDEDGQEIRWSCGGDYLFHLIRAGESWKIDAVKFDMKWEQGTR